MKPYTIRSRKLVGSPHMRYALCVSGVEIHATITPISEAEAIERVKAYHFPPEPRPFRVVDSGVPRRSPGRPPKVSKPSAGWRDDDLEIA